MVSDGTPAVDVSKTHNARDPGSFSMMHVLGNLTYILVFGIVVAYTIMTWIMYSQTHDPKKPVSTAPGSTFDRLLLASAILATLAVVLTVFVLWYHRPGLVAYGHILKYTE
jgi:hypothetical protein